MSYIFSLSVKVHTSIEIAPASIAIDPKAIRCEEILASSQHKVLIHCVRGGASIPRAVSQASIHATLLASGDR